MNNDRFEALMRTGESYHAARLPEGQYIVVRVDGHGFSKFTAQHYEKPFDPAFHECMVRTAQALLEEFGSVYAYTESDEISVLLPLNWAMFGRSHEKTISISAGLASAVFTRECGHLARFDSRVWLSHDLARVRDYFRWRQSDATRCALNGWCYWTLRQQGQSYTTATKALEGQTSNYKRELLKEHGVDFEQTPAWQQRGVGLYWETFEKTGHNPVTGQDVTATRRRIAVQRDLPVGEEYAAYIVRLMAENGTTP